MVTLSLRVAVPVRAPIRGVFSSNCANLKIRRSSVVRASETDLEEKDIKDTEGGGAQIFQNAADSLGVSLGAYEFDAGTQDRPRTDHRYAL